MGHAAVQHGWTMREYEQDEFFAYVESYDILAVGTLELSVDQLWMKQLFEARRTSGLLGPDRLMWLDCVHADYIAHLPWRAEECRIGSIEDSARRRTQIREFDASRFVVVPLLTSGPDRRAFMPSGGIAPSSWHVVRISARDGVPVVTGSDYEMRDADGVRMLSFVSRCTAGERRVLRNVFNFDFLPDASLNGRSTPEPGGAPSDRGGPRADQAPGKPSIRSAPDQQASRQHRARGGAAQ